MLTFYTRGFGDVGQRLVNVTASDDGIATTLDQNVYGDGLGCILKYAYTAPANGQLVLTFEAVNPADTWHHYAFSNELATSVYLDPTPVPGAEVSIYSQLSWIFNGIADQPLYHLTVATDSAMSSVIEDVSNLSVATYNPALSPETDYYWQVEVVDQGATIYTSPVWTFRTLPVPPDAVKLLEWKFDETQGVIAQQTGSAEGADGILCGFNDPDSSQVHVDGISGKAVSLNGADEYVDVSSAYPLMPVGDGQSFSISGYLRTFDDYGPLFSMRNSIDEDPIIDIALGADGVQVEAGKICLLVRDDAGSISWVNSGMMVNDGRWHHFAVTRVDSDWTLYVDGISRATINGAAAGNVDLDFMAIGTSLKWVADNWQSENSYFRDFKGVLDEYTVWSGELQPPQIAGLTLLVPPQGDIDFDLDTDLGDLSEMASNWRVGTWTPVQSTEVLEDMETYTSNPDTFQDYWTYTPEDGFGDLVLSVLPDLNGLYGQVMQLDYDFSTGGSHAHVPVTLINRGANMALFDRVDVRIKKLPGCELSKIIMDFYDGRGKVNPSADELYEKSHIEFDISNVAVGDWTIVSGMIPGSDPDVQTCNDLYQIVFSIEDGGADTGALLLDSIEFADGTEDCVPAVGQMVPDINRDCSVDLLDLAEIVEGWLNGI